MFQSLGKIIHTPGIATSPTVRGVTAAMIVEQANTVLVEMFGASAGTTIQSMYFKNNTLAIGCLSSVAAQEVRLREKELLQKLASCLKHGTVDKIKYVL